MLARSPQSNQIFPKLNIPSTIAAGPGPGNTDDRVLEAYTTCGIADHMHPSVINGMIECKKMLRSVFGTENTYTFGVAGTGWSGLDCMFSAVEAGDKVVAFVNGTFSGIDALTLRLKAATAEELAANPLDPDAKSVIVVNVPHGESVSVEVIEATLAEHKPKWAFMAHWETGSGRINDIQGLSESCEKHGALGLVDAVSSLGIENFKIDDFPGIAAWASCPQKGIMCLPLTYAPVSFNDAYIDVLKQRGCRTYVHNPIFEARHWGVADGEDTETCAYHRTHSAYAVSAFHEALRIILEEGIEQRSRNYARHEAILRDILTNMGCKVTSNMTSLLVLDLPDEFAGREKELVQACRAEDFCIWPTLSEPVQIRIGILNLLTKEALTEIVSRFGKAVNNLGGNVDVDAMLAQLDAAY